MLDTPEGIRYVLLLCMVPSQADFVPDHVTVIKGPLYETLNELTLVSLNTGAIG